MNLRRACAVCDASADFSTIIQYVLSHDTAFWPAHGETTNRISAVSSGINSTQFMVDTSCRRRWIVRQF